MNGDINLKVPSHIVRLAKDSALQVSVRVGRNGITESLITEIRDQLATRQLVKIKANRGITDGSDERSELFELLASQTDSKLVFQRGNVAVFWVGK